MANRALTKADVRFSEKSANDHIVDRYFLTGTNLAWVRCLTNLGL